MKTRRQPLFLLVVLVSLLSLPNSVWACACCSNPGDYHIGFSKPSAYEISLMQQVRFGGTAHLYLTEADLEESAKGLAHRVESYSVTGSLVGNAWKLEFRDGNKSGTLSLALPAKVLKHTADIRDGRTGDGGGPLLYKEWRFEGQARGTGIFRAGTGPTKYFLVLQGRGNGCQSAEDFRHWRLEITGKGADYAFYGELANPE